MQSYLDLKRWWNHTRACTYFDCSSPHARIDHIAHAPAHFFPSWCLSHFMIFFLGDIHDIRDCPPETRVLEKHRKKSFRCRIPCSEQRGGLVGLDEKMRLCRYKRSCQPDQVCRIESVPTSDQTTNGRTSLLSVIDLYIYRCIIDFVESLHSDW